VALCSLMSCTGPNRGKICPLRQLRPVPRPIGPASSRWVNWFIRAAAAPMPAGRNGRCGPRKAAGSRKHVALLVGKFLRLFPPDLGFPTDHFAGGPVPARRDAKALATWAYLHNGKARLIRPGFSATCRSRSCMPSSTSTYRPNDLAVI